MRLPRTGGAFYKGRHERRDPAPPNTPNEVAAGSCVCASRAVCPSCHSQVATPRWSVGPSRPRTVRKLVLHCYMRDDTRDASRSDSDMTSHDRGRVTLKRRRKLAAGGQGCLLPLSISIGRMNGADAACSAVNGPAATTRFATATRRDLVLGLELLPDERSGIGLRRLRKNTPANMPARQLFGRASRARWGLINRPRGTDKSPCHKAPKEIAWRSCRGGDRCADALNLYRCDSSA